MVWGSGLRSRGLRRPVIATGRPMAAVAGASYLTGGVIGLVAALLLNPGGKGVGPILLLVSGCIAIGLALVGVAVRGIRLPPAVFSMLTVAAVGLIAVGVWAARGNILAMAFASLLILVSMFASSFFGWLAAGLFEVCIVATLVAVTLFWQALPWAAVVATSGQSLIVAAILGWLVRAAAKAETDGLTGLADRRGFDQAVKVALDHAARTGQELSVAFLDLDDLGAVNDQQGRPAGDRLLRTVAQEWAALAGPDAVLARYGGDAFALLTPATTTRATGLLETFRTQSATGASFSAGLAGSRRDDTPAALTSRAEAALYEAKRAGGSRIFCSQDVTEDNWSELAAALADGELSVVYQPIVALGAGVITGAEALLRWNPPGQEPVSPVEFIPRAERSGFVTELGRFVLKTACREAAGWPRSVPAKIAVNASGRELHQPGYYDQVVSTLIETGLPAERLVIEVTESMLDADSAIALNTLHRLRAVGIRIAIDDFGTGYSSLSRLSHLPADTIKIDRSFVAEIPPDAQAAPLIAAITALAQALGMGTVAEGVEEPYQAVLLAQHGCDEVQGWLYGHPGPPGVIREALQLRADAVLSGRRTGGGADGEGGLAEEAAPVRPPLDLRHRQPGGLPDDPVEIPVDRGQTGSEQRGHRVGVIADHREVAGDVQPQLAGGGVHPVRDRIGEAEHRSGPVDGGQHPAGDGGGAR